MEEAKDEYEHAVQVAAMQRARDKMAAQLKILMTGTPEERKALLDAVEAEMKAGVGKGDNEQASVD